MDDFIEKIRTLREEREKVEEALSELYTPILDVSYAKWLRERIPDRDVYLMVALRLFSPKSLGGARMVWGKSVRDELSKQMGLSKGYVSKQIKEVLTLYRVVRSFRKKVNKTYAEILEEIKKEKIK